MRLGDLLSAASMPLAAPLAPAQADLEIHSLTLDSRQVVPGSLFAALPGSQADGRTFIPHALSKGAVAVLSVKGTDLPAGSSASLLTCDDPSHWLAVLASVFHAPQPRVIACVTGTSGKTSVAHFTRSLWEALGLKAASLGTLGVVPAVETAPASLTTPDSVGLHRCLQQLQDQGIEHAVLEASSHGLDQHRLDGLEVSAAAFTNLSHEHLDYHKTMEAYFAAKARLFERLLRPDGVAVLNADTPYYEALTTIARRRGQRIFSYGISGAANLRLLEQKPKANGQSLLLQLDGQERRVQLPLIGDFQACNALAAVGLVVGTGGDPSATLNALSGLVPVPGRLEFVGTTTAGGSVYVDYAHKPAALEAVLTTLRPYAKRHLWVVVGCGGDRDREKRPIMGRMAAELADHGIITDDNPRSEEPAAIRAAMLQDHPDLVEIGDRRQAIETAVHELKKGDLLVIAGKGHESGQTIGKEVLPFDDREVARSAISASDQGTAA